MSSQDTYIIDVFDDGIDTIQNFDQDDTIRVTINRPPDRAFPDAIQEPQLRFLEISSEMTKLELIPVATQLVGSVMVQLEGDYREESFRFDGETLRLAGEEEQTPPQETVVWFTPLDSSQREGDSGETIFTFEVIREGNLDQEVSIDYVVESPPIIEVVDGMLGATADDFGGEFPRGTVTLNSGEAQQIIEIPVTGDLEPEIERIEGFNYDRFTVSLENPPEGVVFEESTIYGEIIDDDGEGAKNKPPQEETFVTLYPLESSQLEGDGGETIFTFEVFRDGNLETETTVDYVVESPMITAEVDGRLAVNAADFGGEFPSGTITFAAGEEYQVLEIAVTGDLDPEIEAEGELNRELFTVSLLSETGNLESDLVIGEIIDDDGEFSPEAPIEAKPLWLMSMTNPESDDFPEQSIDTDSEMENRLGFGSEENDYFGDGNGGNRLYGNQGDDYLVLTHRDRAFGGDDDDIINASQGQGENRAYGGNGDDFFFVGANDFYAGGEGKDEFFVGTGGNNRFVGGADQDTFSIANNGVIPDAPNLITDFESGVDRLGINDFNISFSALEIRQEDTNTIVALFNNDLATLLNTDAQNIGVEDFTFG